MIALAATRKALVPSKLAPGREKDRILAAEMLRHHLADVQTLRQRLDDVTLYAPIKTKIVAWLETQSQ